MTDYVLYSLCIVALLVTYGIMKGASRAFRTAMYYERGKPYKLDFEVGVLHEVTLSFSGTPVARGCCLLSKLSWVGSAVEVTFEERPEFLEIVQVPPNA